MFSVRVSNHLTGRPTVADSHGRRASSGYGEILAPKPPPTSGTITWMPPVACSPYRASKVSFTPCGPWLDIQTTSLSPSHAAAVERTSIGAEAVLWCETRPATTASQSAKKASSVMPVAMPRFEKSTATLVPTAECTTISSVRASSGSTTTGSGS